MNATFIGRHEHDHRLPDYSEDGAGDTVAEMEALLDESAALLDREGLSGSGSAPHSVEATDVLLARGYVRTQLWEFEGRHFHRGNPSAYVGEAVFGVLSLFLTSFAPLSRRVQAAVARLEAMPKLLEQARENVRSAPVAWTDRALRECRGLVAFLTEGVDLLIAREGAATRDLRRAADRALHFVRRFGDHLASDLRQRPADHYCCGTEALDLYLREGHFLADDAEDIDAYATDRLAEAEGRLQAGLEELRASSAAEALGRLKHHHPSLEDYYGRYQELWNETRDLARARDLLTWPDAPIRYVARPEWARSAAPDLYFLFYRSPAAFERPPVHDYLVTPIEASMPEDERRALLQTNNESVIKLNHVIHHGGVGHHVQNWHAFRAESRIGRVAAVDCASRIAMFCGGTMAEGWACYATDLMSEAGALTELERYAEHQACRRMCARAVVDVRLHTGRMTLGEATGFYRQRGGMSEAAAEAEAVKNSMFPGTALMYLVGTDEIHRLRRELEAARGPDFSLRAFHDELLSYGSIPVSLIARDMRQRSRDAH